MEVGPPCVVLPQFVALGQVTSYPGPLRIFQKMSTLGFIFEDTSSLNFHQPLRHHSPRSRDETAVSLLQPVLM